MNIRSITAIIAFAALAIALNTVRIPTFYLPGMFYTLCDIPVVIPFLLFGFRVGLLGERVHVWGRRYFLQRDQELRCLIPWGL